MRTPTAALAALPDPALTPEGCRRAVRCRACTVRQTALFVNLTPEELDAIAWKVPDEIVPAGKPLYRHGEQPDAIFIVRSGLIKLETYLNDGSYRIVRLARCADLLALERLLDSPCDHTAIALSDVDVCKVPLAVVRQVMAHQPWLSTQMIRHWHQALQQADGWLAQYSLGAGRQRVARFLIDLHDTTSDASGAFTIPNRDDVGAILGLTKETTSRLIAEFHRSGFLTKLDQQRAVIHRDSLDVVAQGD